MLYNINANISFITFFFDYWFLVLCLCKRCCCSNNIATVINIRVLYEAKQILRLFFHQQKHSTILFIVRSTLAIQFQRVNQFAKVIFVSPLIFFIFFLFCWFGVLWLTPFFFHYLHVANACCANIKWSSFAFGILSKLILSPSQVCSENFTAARRRRCCYHKTKYAEKTISLHIRVQQSFSANPLITK